jgi:peptide/nickel transport system substrate-binding protein
MRRSAWRTWCRSARRRGRLATEGDRPGVLCSRVLRSAAIGVAALTLVTAAAGCDVVFGSPQTGDGHRIGNRDPRTVVIARATDAISLDPGLATDNESAEVIFQIYDTLIEWEPGTATIAPGLATSWTADDSGTVWTFELAPNVRFHDGTPLDAAAIVFALERQRDPAHPFHRPDFQYWPNSFKNIRRVEEVDRDTIRITIEGPYAPFLANMTMFPVSAVSPAAVARWGDEFGDHPVGTGPFVFDRWDKGERIVLRRNPDYWRRDRVPELERLVFATISDPRQRLIQLESGAIDLAVSILPEELQFVDLHPGLVLHQTAASNVSYLAMHLGKRPLGDLGVRRAIAHAINKEPIVQLAFQGIAIPADGPLPPIQWGYHKPRASYAYDPSEARRLLADAQARGAWDPDQVLDLYAPSTPRPYLPSPERVARAIQANLAEVGVHTRLILQPFPDHLKSTRRLAHDLCILGWVGDNGDPDNFLQQLDRTNTTVGSAINVADYRNGLVHHLLSEAQETDDRLERERLYARVQEIVAEEVPWVPLAHAKVALAARDDLTGLILNPTGQVLYRSVRRNPE